MMKNHLIIMGTYLHSSYDSDIYISRDRLSAFKEWLDR
jgi:hypothetical protein